MIKLKRDLPILGVITAVLLIIGAFFDLQLSQAIYNPASGFGQFFNVLGEIPAVMILAFSTLAISLVSKNQGKTFKCVLFMILSVLSSFFAGSMVSGRIDGIDGMIKNIVMLVIAVAVFLIVYFPAMYAAKDNGEALYKAAVTGALLFLISVLAVNIIKMGWGRERYRHMIEVGSTAGFSAWYLPQGLADGNEFMSFPSGHSANAAVSLWLILVPTYTAKLKGKENLFKSLAGVWTGLVMVSRVIMGAHFLSDVTMGMAISVLIFCLLYHSKYEKA